MTRTTRSRTTAAALGLALTAGLTAGLTAATTSPAAAGILPTWSQDDPTGDVAFTDARGLTRAERRSIDASFVATYDLQDDQTLINVDIEDVTDSRRFDQAVGLTFLNRRGNAVGRVTYLPSPGDRTSGTAVLGDGADAEVCEGLVTQVFDLGETDRASTTVPDRCIPSTRVRVRAVTVTGNLRGDDETHSRDRVASDGLVRVRTAEPAAG